MASDLLDVEAVVIESLYERALRGRGAMGPDSVRLPPLRSELACRCCAVL